MNKVSSVRYCVNVPAIFVVFFLLCLVLSRKAYAYIDPGTGSYIFQMMIAFFVGGLFAIKVFWRKIKGFFGQLSSKERRIGEDER